MTPAHVKRMISPELLNQIDIRVGTTIESVSDVANSERLVALRANFGDHVRTVLAGMKRERANPSSATVGVQRPDNLSLV
jgi:tRNA-binding protein